MQKGTPWVWRKLAVPEQAEPDDKPAWRKAWQVVRTGIIALNGRLASLMQLLQEEASLVVDVTWDPPSVNNGIINGTTVVTVPGAEVGDRVLASFSQPLPVGYFITATVTAARQVTVVIDNRSGGTVDLASGTLSLKLWA